MKSKISTKIKKRKNANDVFLTPLSLVKTHIDLISYNDNDVWLDPFKGTGNYYNSFPSKNKFWCEITDGIDFFNFNKPIDIICSNPPYSIINKILSKSVELKPRIISYLIGMGNLTCKRIEFMNNNGYGLTKIHMCKVFKWYGMSFIVVFEKNKDNIITFDRKIWK